MNKKLTTFSTLALLLTATAAPAVFAEQAAKPAAAQIRLDLEAALAAGRAGIGPQPVTVTVAPAEEAAAADAPPRFSELSRDTAREAMAAKQRTATLEREAMPKRGIGAWLKKHWYVPVLIGAGIAVVVADDDDGPDDDD